MVKQNGGHLIIRWAIVEMHVSGCRYEAGRKDGRIQDLMGEYEKVNMVRVIQ
jgi:hypothetical protein